MFSFFLLVGRWKLPSHASRQRVRWLFVIAAVASGWTSPLLLLLGAPNAVMAEYADAAVVPATETYRSSCARCHGADGRGAEHRRGREGLPDFARRDWQSRRSDAQLTVSILNGKGTEMPSLRDRLSDDRVKGLIAQIRAFAPPKSRSTSRSDPPVGKPDLDASGGPRSDFDAEFRRLKDEYNALSRQLRDLHRTPD